MYKKILKTNTKKFASEKKNTKILYKKVGRVGRQILNILLQKKNTKILYKKSRQSR